MRNYNILIASTVSSRGISVRSGTNTLARTLIQQQKGQLLLLMHVTSISADGSSVPTLRGDRNPPVSKRYC